MVKNRFYSSLKKIINNEKGNNKMNNHLLINKRMIYYENQFMLQDTISNSNFKNNKINNYNINLSKEEEEKKSNDDNKKDNENIKFQKKSDFTPVKYIPQYDNINNNINNTIYNIPCNRNEIPVINNSINLDYKKFLINQFNNNYHLNRINKPSIIINKCDLINGNEKFQN